MLGDHLVIPALILALIAAIASGSPSPRQAAGDLVQAIGVAVGYGEQQGDGDTAVLNADDSSQMRW